MEGLVEVVVGVGGSRLLVGMWSCELEEKDGVSGRWRCVVVEAAQRGERGEGGAMWHYSFRGRCWRNAMA